MSCEEKQFCSRPSRLFGGDPAALFAQDTVLLKAETTITALSSPFQFDLSFAPQGSNSFLLVSKFALEIFSLSQGGVNNIVNNAQRFQLLPPSAAGQPSTLSPGGPFDPNIYGVSLQKLGAGVVNSLANPWGYFRQKIKTPFYVPPAWLLRMTILDLNLGPNYLQPGMIVRLVALAAAIPSNFAQMP